MLYLASALDVPLHQQNAMLLSAGFAPAYRERAMDAPDMRSIDRAIEQLLQRQAPYPAIVVDQGYDIIRANAVVGTLLAFLMGPAVAATAEPPPMNAIEILLRPKGLRPLVENWDEVASWSVRRLRAEATAEGPGGAAAVLLARILLLPGVAAIDRSPRPLEEPAPMLVLRLRRGDTRLALFSIIATLGTPLDVTLQNLRLELFFPADAQTGAWFERVAPATLD